MLVNQDRGDRPITDAAVILTATRTSAIRQHRAWTVRLEDDGSFRRTAATSDDGIHWTQSSQSPPFASWQEAVADDPELTLLQNGRPTVFHIDGAENELLLASLLRFGSPGASDTNDWRHAATGTIGLRQISFLPRPDTGKFVAVLGDEYGDTTFSYDDTFSGNLLAQCYWREIWQNDDGTDEYDDPSPLTSGSALVEISPGLCVKYPTDEEAISERPILVVLTNDPERRAAGVMEWIADLQISPDSNALALEPLDADGQLSQQQRAEWESALEDPRYSVTFRLDEATNIALRARLAQDLTYRNIRAALAEPLGENGQRLLRSLQQPYTPPGPPH